jgi:hypothetical protein
MQSWAQRGAATIGVNQASPKRSPAEYLPGAECDIEHSRGSARPPEETFICLDRHINIADPALVADL